ncbi:MAG: helix-turn-helix domain-containing protein [archaeon]
MSIVCEFDLLSKDIPVTEVARGLRTELHVDDVISGVAGPPNLVFSASGVDPDRLTVEMDAAPSILEYVALESAFVESRYRVVLDGAHTDVYHHLVTLRTHPMGAVIKPQGWNVTARFADRSDLGAFREACGDCGVEFRPRRLFEPMAEQGDDYGLTTPQHEALLVAYREGYFEVPREATLADLADDLETTTSALSERLRRGQRQLLARTLAASVS